MGLILDSSVVIAAERRGDTVEKLIEQVISVTGDQDAALSSIGLTELVHGIYRAQTQAMRLRRQSFIDELLVGATARELGFPVLTVNLRHFRLIPGLKIVRL
jgi:predicted nucleic acid-binding protein